ncbi:MAG: ankyrin repeat domain-containing protein [Mariniblastus sp.]
MSNDEFFQAVVDNQIDKVIEMLVDDSSLARNCHNNEGHSTEGFPLTAACAAGHVEVARILLDHGAHPDSPSQVESTERPGELGMPLHHAVRREDYVLANLLLDYNAIPNGYPYCDQSTIERLFYQAKNVGASESLLRNGYSNYLPARSVDHSAMELAGNSPESLKLFVRILKLGGQPPFCCLVREGYDHIAEEILQHALDKPGTPHDFPHSNTFENIFGAARWHGYPKLVKRSMELFPERFDASVAKATINVAISSHNRDGSYADYREIICDQLEYLITINELDRAIADPEFQPLHKIATDFCWHANYGYKAEIAKPECYIDLAELFMEHGFRNIDYRDPQKKLSTLAAAVNRGHHPGMAIYVKYLIDQGADLCACDPEKTNPLAIAKQKELAEIIEMLSTN